MKKKILFIDDELTEENSQAYQICNTLQDRGYEILSCISFKWDEIKTIIKENYRSLRLILCDLQDSHHNPSAGWNIISNIKAPNNIDNLIKDNKWFIECIPIIVITQTQEYHKERNDHGSEFITLFDKAACQGQSFKGCVDILTNLFDKLCQEKMRFKVAISYTWNNKQTNDNHQPYVEHVAHSLFEKYKKENVFYDTTKISETAGSYLENLPEQIYNKGCDFVLIFLSNDYATSGWTEKEWEQTKQREDKKFLFVAIDNIEKYTVAKNLFSKEWKEKITDDNNEEDKKVFFQKHMPLYFDCHEDKETFDFSRRVNKITEHNKAIESIELNIEKIIRNIDRRIND